MLPGHGASGDCVKGLATLHLPTPDVSMVPQDRGSATGLSHSPSCSYLPACLLGYREAPKG